ncbi:hypothetical protein EHV15_33560 [Paenibacillus oralis]|uniref:SLH domain-containing protein n=2 Tax=Paenibacillus oralis TaxID=2490856 RepID=A0A3P3UC29_9BACL|nr:hypothetical protein EHV15_33560 [Paenibacillus oralis]
MLLAIFALLTGLIQAAIPSVKAEEKETILLPKNSTWKYLDTGVDQKNLWRTDHSGKDWPTGSAPFGYSASAYGGLTSQFGPLETVTSSSYGSDSRNKPITTYLVTEMHVDMNEIEQYGQLLATFAVDDGVVIYVNGTEVYRVGMPKGEIQFSTLAATLNYAPVVFKNVDLTALLKANLKDGENVIAVEVHQGSKSSSNLYFDMELTALKEAPASEVSKVAVTFHGDPKTSKGFVWYTPIASARSDLQIVERTAATPDFDQALSFTGHTQVSSNSPTEHVHKAEATGLKPDTAYYFRVGDQTLDIWSDVGTFETAPEGGAFTFIDLADTQAQEEDQAVLSSQTLTKALATVPDAKFVVHNGDFVENGHAEGEWNQLLGYSQESLLNTTIVPAAGNHEPYNSAFFEHFNVEPAENSDTTTGAYYSYDYSNVHFIVLNTNENSTEYADMSLHQVEWLKQDVEKARAAGAEWIIVNMHIGPYTISNHATDSDVIGENGLRNKIAPLMAELKIDLVLQGHDHIYARTKPIKRDGTAADTDKITETLHGESIEYTVNPDGTIYLIPATAGAFVYFKNKKEQLGDAYFNLFERAEENHAAKYGSTPNQMKGHVQNFVGITVDGRKLTAVAYEIDQNLNNAEPFIVDQFGIVKERADTTPNHPSKPVRSGDHDSSGGISDSDPSKGAGAGTDTGAGENTIKDEESELNPTDDGNGTAPTLHLNDIAGHWAAAAIKRGIEAGVVKGYGDGNFRPDAAVNRAEFITMLGRALKLQDSGSKALFKDLANIPVWAQIYVVGAANAGIISGYADGTFGPSKILNRAELVVMIARAANIQPDEAAVLTFSDMKDIPAWAAPYVAAASKESFVSGVGQNRFAPKQSVTRAEALALIMSLLKQ